MSKQTSPRVSTIAAKYIKFDSLALSGVISGSSESYIEFLADIRSMAASCMSQDEAKGNIFTRIVKALWS